MQRPPPRPPDAADAATDSRPARRRRRRRRHLPARPAAADPGLSAGRHGRRAACARLGAGQRARARPRRIRHRVPDVLDRPRVQPAAAEGDAARGVRAGTRAGRDHDDRRDAGAASRRLRLAGGLRARRRARDELDRDRLEDARRAHGARHAARPRRDGHPAVPGSRGRRVPDHPAVARARPAPTSRSISRWRPSRRRSRWC